MYVNLCPMTALVPRMVAPIVDATGPTTRRNAFRLISERKSQDCRSDG